jgi:para-nitrobenzyl esterase
MIACQSVWVLLWVSIAIADPNVVRIDSGEIRGTTSEHAGDVRVFRGIPYAASTEGANRWKPPQPVAKWEGIRDCTKFGPACPQPAYPKESVYYRDPEPQSEDCLRLNVWTAAKEANEKRPVMVWIHGGALTRGSGAVDIYDGTSLAKKGVVIVTINYRLGPLGFFAHPDLTKESSEHASGNYGFLDQVAALEWVKRNISQFGGDPGCVTIFGESAGAMSVCVMTVSPLSRGLFHRAISESGSAFLELPSLTTSEDRGRQLQELVRATSLADLRNVSPEELIKHSEKRVGPNIDGWCIKEDVLSTFEAGKQHPVPTIVGSNADEMTTLAPLTVRPKSKRALDIQIALLIGNPKEIERLYPVASDDDAANAFLDIAGDATFTMPARTWARLNTKIGATTYLYHFAHVANATKSLGAFHASEIAYVFDNLGRMKRNVDEDERSLAHAMSTYWTTFAKTGNPNGPGTAEWVPYVESDEPTMVFASPATIEHHVRKDKLDLLETLMEKRRGKGETSVR